MVPEKVRKHLETYWTRARDSFKVGDVPLAAFLAITLIEEVGKVALLANAKLSGELNRKAFRNHEAKYAYAVYTTLFVNSRTTRIYGPHESRFAAWFRDGSLFKIRNSAIYLEQRDHDLIVPADAVSREDAFLLVCIAGEVLAEAQGLYLGSTPSEWTGLLTEVDAFHAANR
jgi:AbiV family abortive infection protein